eukprot:Awhi_evm1s15311
MINEEKGEKTNDNDNANAHDDDGNNDNASHNHSHGESLWGIIVRIYRVSGRQTEIKSLQAKISTANSRHRDINLILEEEPNIHNISGLLKGYFRDLPQKLLNAQIYDKISAVVNLLN